MRFLRRASALAVLLVLVLAPRNVAADDPGVVSHGPRDEKVIALTFDDGWSTPRCHKILSTLVLKKVPATFFPNALYVRQHPEFWRRVAELGFPIGNHTVNHLDLTELTGAGVFKEINRDREIVEQITGVRMIRVMRPPFGSFNKRTLRQAAKAGFPTVLLWDTTASDTSRHASKRSMIKGALSGKNGSVVVLHCGPKETPQILPRIIEGYRARGFRFVTIPELLGIEKTTRVVHRSWEWWPLHAPSESVVVAGACPPRTVAAAAGHQASGIAWKRTFWSRRLTDPCWNRPSHAAAHI